MSRRLVQEVSAAIGMLKDPRLGFLTVTGAQVSPDLREARVRVSILGTATTQAECFAVLQGACGRIQNIVAGKLAMKVTPRITLVHDRSAEYADDISRLIARARATDPEPTHAGETTTLEGEDGR